MQKATAQSWGQQYAWILRITILDRNKGTCRLHTFQPIGRQVSPSLGQTFPGTGSKESVANSRVPGGDPCRKFGWDFVRTTCCLGFCPMLMLSISTSSNTGNYKLTCIGGHLVRYPWSGYWTELAFGSPNIGLRERSPRISELSFIWYQISNIPTLMDRQRSLVLEHSLSIPWGTVVRIHRME